MDTQGVSSEVQEAIARRGMGQQAPMMDQGSSMAPQAPAMPQMGAPATSGKQEFVPKDSHEMLVSTLAESLKNEYKLKGEMAKMNTPQAPMM